MTQIYYKNDFTARIMLRDRQDNAVAVPPCDWRARLSTPGSPRHVAISQKGGERRGFTVDTDGAVVVPMDGHGLWPGPLIADFEFELPDGGYPDGAQHIERHYHLDIDLTMNPDDLPCDAEAVVEIPWLYVHDTDVYASILRKVNESLAEILGKQLDDVPQQSAPRAASRSSVFVQRGMMRTGAMPGVIYDGLVGAPCEGGREKLAIKLSGIRNYAGGMPLPTEWVSLQKAFPGGLFYGREIEVSFGYGLKGEYDRVNNRVRIIEVDDCYSDGTVVSILVPYNTRSHYLTTDTAGRVIYADIVGPAIRLMLDTDFELGGLVDGSPALVEGEDGNQICLGHAEYYGYALTKTGECLELQWYRRPKKSRKYSWRKILFPNKCKYGIFRVRRKSQRGYRSDWVYYSVYKTSKGDRAYKRL